jgi:hypothetical protein
MPTNLYTVFSTILMFFFCSGAGAAFGTEDLFLEGDILFQSLNTSQSRAIRLATGSDYTHCGIVLEKDGQMYVYEAVATVGWTPLERWLERSGRHYAQTRLVPSARLTPDKLAALHELARSLAGKPYDLLFQWSDDTMYCSELVWKLFKAVDIELAPLRALRDYDLDHDEVQRKVKERFGLDVPWDEPVIAPSDLLAGGTLAIIGEH